jgi:hypothetical protein
MRYVMNTNKRLIHVKGLCIFFGILFWLALNWPFLTLVDGKGSAGMFVYFFASWALAIAVLFLLSLGLGRKGERS